MQHDSSSMATPLATSHDVVFFAFLRRTQLRNPMGNLTFRNQLLSHFFGFS